MMYPLFLNLNLFFPMNEFFIHIIFFWWIWGVLLCEACILAFKKCRRKREINSKSPLVKPEGGEKKIYDWLW